MKSPTAIAFVASLLLLSLSLPAAAKLKVGDLEPGGKQDEWDEELDKEWEEWEARTAKRKPKREEPAMDPMEMVKQFQQQQKKGGSGPSDAVFASAGGSMAMAFMRLDPRKIKNKEDADELTGRLVSLQRTGGGGDQWYTIDAETLLVNVAKGSNLREVKDFALTLPEVYEFEWQSNVFRRPEDTMTYEELKESLGMKVDKPATPPKKESKPKKGKKAKSRTKKGTAAKEEL